MPAKAKVKIKKTATKKVAIRKSKKVNAPRPLNVGKKTAVKKKIIKKKIISRKSFEANILNSFKIHPLADFKEKITVDLTPIKFSRLLTKTVVLFLIVMLNWFGLSAVGRTLANFNDTETSEENLFQAGALDFSLSGPDFSPAVTPSQNATSTIDLQDSGLMDFTYGAEVKSASGTLCNFLQLEDNLTNTYGALSTSISATTTFPAVDNIIFDARLTSASKALQNKMCEFKFVFDGEQIDGAGFSDTEEISRTIRTGEWPNIVINKVYYDPDETHSGDLDEWKYEWIELYNPFDHAVNLKDWQICDNTSCKTINANVDIPALGYVLLSHDNSVWQHYWEIPEGVETINLGNATPHLALANGADMLVLINSDSAVVDQMNWGTPNHGWANYDDYSAGVWESGVVDADEGHMLGRVPSGFDTDSVSDWQDLELPEVTLIYPVGGEKWYVGQTYNLRWTASSTNESLDSELKIDLYYSNNSGNSWAAIATSTENDGTYTWKVPVFLDYGKYYVPSPKARIKVVATGPENFMVQTATSSKDFCPPIDYDALGYEEQQLVDQLVRDGVIDPSEVIRGGVSQADILAGMESEPEPEIILEQAPVSEEIIEEVIIETAEEAPDAEDDVIIIENTAGQGATVEIMPEDTTGETEAESADEITNDQEILNTDLNTDEPAVIEPTTEPALEPEPAVSPEPIVEAPPAPEPPLDSPAGDQTGQATPEPAAVPEAAPEAPATN
jgi:predicted ribosomally synthesized peptide with SipW-like signal peptide